MLSTHTDTLRAARRSYTRHVAESSWASSPGVRASMRANRGRDTGPELALRSAVHALGGRYRVGTRPLPELRRTADLVFRAAKVAVFLDGCYWHGCPTHHTVAITNAGFWAEKVAGNRRRDRDTDRRLAEAGWVSVRIWEHEDPLTAARSILSIVRDRRPAARPAGRGEVAADGAHRESRSAPTNGEAHLSQFGEPPSW